MVVVGPENEIGRKISKYKGQLFIFDKFFWISRKNFLIGFLRKIRRWNF